MIFVNKNKLILSLLIAISILNNLYGQQIIGKVNDENNKPLSFVNIYLTSIADTTKILKGTSTDFQGNFILKINKIKLPFYLFTSFLGYETKKIKFDSIPQKKLNIQLNSSSNQLNEIVIKTDKPIKHYVNKTVYTIQKSTLKKSTTGFDVLKVVPELRIDENNNSIQTLQQKNIEILINGIHSSSIDIKALNPKDIAKIEYYEMPTARYQNMGVSSVINVITKNNIRGGSIMIDTKQSILPFAVGDYLFSSKYNHKNSQFNLYYNYSNRNYSKKKYLSENSFKINNQVFNEKSESFLYPFGYDMHILKTSYSLVKNENYTFNINFNSTFTKSYDKPKYKFNRVYATNTISGIGKSTYFYKEFTPKIDLYFQKKLRQNKQLIFNIVGQKTNVKSDYEMNEKDTDNTVLLTDFSYDKNTKKSIIGEIVYDFNIKKIQFETGAFYKYGNLTQITNNYFAQGKNELNKQEIRFYTSANGRFKKFSYMIDVNFKNLKFDKLNSTSKYSKNKLTTGLSLFYQISKQSNLSFIYSNKVNEPSLSNLNEQQYFIKPNFIQKGNANLKPYNTNSFTLSYNFNKSNFVTNFKTGYSISTNPIFTHYYIKNNQLISSYFNGNRSTSLYFAIYLKQYLFKKKLNVSLYTSVYKFKNKFSTNDTKELKGNYLYFNLEYYYKKFILDIKLQNPYKRLNDYTIHKLNVDSNINLRYKYKAWTFGVGWYLPFEKSYLNEFTGNSTLFNDYSKVEIYDSANYFYLKLNYNFAFGKQLKIQKKVSNSDNDNGTIKH